MPRKTRDYKAEYARRKAHGLARGLSLFQARGHARAAIGEKPVSSSKPALADRLFLAVRDFLGGKPLSSSAQAANVHHSTLKKHLAKERLLAPRAEVDRRWKPTENLRRVSFIDDKGKAITIPVSQSDFETWQRFRGDYTDAVATADQTYLDKWAGVTLRNTVTGEKHTLSNRLSLIKSREKVLKKDPYYRLVSSEPVNLAA